MKKVFATLVLMLAVLSSVAIADGVQTCHIYGATSSPVTQLEQCTSLGFSIEASDFVNDSAFTNATDRAKAIGAQFDNTATDSVDEQDIGVCRMSANRNLYVVIRDDAGGERGLKIDTNGSLAVTMGTGGIFQVSPTTASNLVTNPFWNRLTIDGTSALSATSPMPCRPGDGTNQVTLGASNELPVSETNARSYRAATSDTLTSKQYSEPYLPAASVSGDIADTAVVILASTNVSKYPNYTVWVQNNAASATGHFTAMVVYTSPTGAGTCGAAGTAWVAETVVAACTTLNDGVTCKNPFTARSDPFVCATATCAASTANCSTATAWLTANPN